MSYYSNGETGYMEVFDKPDGFGMGFVNNGELFYVAYSYAYGGESWGIVEYSVSNKLLVPADYSEKSFFGWIRLSDATAKYNSRAFCDDYKDDIKDLNDQLSLVLPEGTKNIVVWTYPHSGEISSVLDYESFEGDSPVFSRCYTDTEGLQWGYFNYFYGYRNGWVCVSDPENESIDGYFAQQVDFTKPSSDQLPDKSGNSITTYTVIIFVCAAVSISSALIVGLGRKKKESTK